MVYFLVNRTVNWRSCKFNSLFFSFLLLFITMHTHMHVFACMFSMITRFFIRTSKIFAKVRYPFLRAMSLSSILLVLIKKPVIEIISLAYLLFLLFLIRCTHISATFIINYSSTNQIAPPIYFERYYLTI